MQRTTFGAVPVGAVFWWGGYTPERSNWGRKRSSRTADLRPRILGELHPYTDWGYLRADEWVFWEPEA